MPVDALVFDLDGTLVDTAPDLHAATNHVLSTLKRRSISMEEVRSFVGHGARALIARGCEATGEPVDPRAIETLYQEFVIYYAANISAYSKPFPGLLDFLDRCKARNIAMAVCTNKLEFLSVQLLQALGLSPYFGAVVGPDTIGIAKPDPRPYHEALHRLGRDVASSIMIGDSETDIRTGQNAGVPVIAVSFGYTPQHVSAFNPTHVIDHYDEAWPILQSYL
ncbi:MAG: HAD-IA family hydrolase [Rhizobiales bacterium]|nr:HAD-IA family hydrolase [Hyphomicrobiales bacterium]